MFLLLQVAARGEEAGVRSRGDLHLLQAIEETLQGKGNRLQSMVAPLRSRDVSWALIGGARGVSRQSAWERFS